MEMKVAYPSNVERKAHQTCKKNIEEGDWASRSVVG